VLITTLHASIYDCQQKFFNKTNPFNINAKRPTERRMIANFFKQGIKMGKEANSAFVRRTPPDPVVLRRPGFPKTQSPEDKAEPSDPRVKVSASVVQMDLHQPMTRSSLRTGRM
jgi:hypothetical protein